MDFNEIIISALSTITLALVGWLFTKISGLIDEKIATIRNEKVQKMLKNAKEELSNATWKGIVQVNETYVKALKADGNFSEEDGKLANMKALEIIKQIMSESALTVLANASIDIDAAINNEIEVQVPLLKKEVTTNG